MSGSFRSKLAKPYRKDPRSLSAQRKVNAYKEICSTIGRLRSYKDCFAGIGLAASVVIESLRPTEVRLQDADESCVKLLREKFLQADVRKLDFFKDPDRSRWDLVSLDFNVFTLLQFRRDEQLRLRTIEQLSRANHLVLTDSARNKFHLNADRYGCADFREYTELLALELGCKLLHVSDQTEVAYLLLKKTARNIPSG